MLDKLKQIDYWRHLWRPFWIFSNAWIVRRTPGSDSAPPNYHKWPGYRLIRKNAPMTLFKHNISLYIDLERHALSFCLIQLRIHFTDLLHANRRTVFIAIV